MSVPLLKFSSKHAVNGIDDFNITEDFVDVFHRNDRFVTYRLLFHWLLIKLFASLMSDTRVYFVTKDAAPYFDNDS